MRDRTRLGSLQLRIASKGAGGRKRARMKQMQLTNMWLKPLNLHLKRKRAAPTLAIGSGDECGEPASGQAKGRRLGSVGRRSPAASSLLPSTSSPAPPPQDHPRHHPSTRYVPGDSGFLTHHLSLRLRYKSPTANSATLRGEI